MKSDVLLLNEIGLDPGIDHCSAFSLLADLRKKGKVIESFASFCRGLPAPDCADVPLKYKFSWSPRGSWEGKSSYFCTPYIKARKYLLNILLSYK